MDPKLYVWNKHGQKLRPILGPTIEMRADCTYVADTSNNNRPEEAEMSTETRRVDKKIPLHIAPEDTANDPVFVELMARIAKTDQESMRAQTERAASSPSVSLESVFNKVVDRVIDDTDKK